METMFYKEFSSQDYDKEFYENIKNGKYEVRGDYGYVLSCVFYKTVTVVPINIIRIIENVPTYEMYMDLLPALVKTAKSIKGE